ncbi:hypothetical protein LOAG_13217, partial [Loa loa]
MQFPDGPTIRRFFLIIVIICMIIPLRKADLWTETKRMSDLQQWRTLCARYTVALAYMKDSNARITVFAPINDVFIYNPDIRAFSQKEVLSHI